MKRIVNFKEHKVLIVEGDSIKKKDIDSDLFFYELRHSNEDWSEIATIEKKVICNYYGYLISLNEIELDQDDSGSKYCIVSEQEGKDLSYDGEVVKIEEGDFKSYNKMKKVLYSEQKNKKELYIECPACGGGCEEIAVKVVGYGMITEQEENNTITSVGYTENAEPEKFFCYNCGHEWSIDERKYFIKYY